MSREEAVGWLADQLVRIAKPGGKIDDVRTGALQLYLRSDKDGGGVSLSDYELNDQILASAQRAQRVHQWASLDLDGDGRVTRAEAERAKLPQAMTALRPQGITADPTRKQIAAILDKLVAETMGQDIDGDGAVTLAEVLQAGVPNAVQQAAAQRAMTRALLVPLALDRNADGVVSAAEFDTSVVEAFAAIDADGDGMLGPGELEAGRQRGNERQRLLQQVAASAAKAKACAFPAPPRGAKIIQLGTYQGEALSNVSIGGDEVETSVAQIAIEAGDDPLYIVAASYEAMIWQFTGATERVAMFIAAAQQPAAGGRPRVGVTGLSAARIYIAPQANCLNHFSNAKGSDGLVAKGELSGLLGRLADDMIGVYALSKVALPSGIVSPGAAYPNRLATSEMAPGAGLWKEVLRSQPGGVAVNDPARVVAALPVRRYEVLPQAAGLAQLLDEGALEVAGEARVIEIGKGAPAFSGTFQEWARRHGSRTVPTEFRIVKKMRFPAGLNGGHSVRFILAKGVPMPDGSPGHSAVISEETGQRVTPR